MREDMAKILVERPRHGRGLKYPRNAGREPVENRPTHEPIKSPYLRQQKSLNENLAPLRRFLRSHVGQPWDKVYSEICERINRNSAVQLHIWQHLMGEVALDEIAIERMWRWHAMPYRHGRGQLYVDPKTKILRITTPQRHHGTYRPWRREAFLVERDGRSFKQVDGIWYEIELVPISVAELVTWDALLSREGPKCYRWVTSDELKWTYGQPVRAVGKRQLNTKEIRWLTVDD